MVWDAIAGAVGSAIGGPAGGAIGRLAGSILFDDDLIGGIAGFATGDFDLGAGIFGGDDWGVGDTAAGFGFGGDPVATLGGTEAGGALARATGVQSSGKGLLSRALSDPLVGGALAGIGEGLLAPDPGEAQIAAMKGRQKIYDKNYKTVAAPSDRRRG